MSGFEVRRDGRLFSVTDAAALRELARAGFLASSEEVRRWGEEAFVRADLVAELQGAFVDDPWAAWASDEAVDDLWERLTVPVDQPAFAPPGPLSELDLPSEEVSQPPTAVAPPPPAVAPVAPTPPAGGGGTPMRVAFVPARGAGVEMPPPVRGAPPAAASAPGSAVGPRHVVPGGRGAQPTPGPLVEPLPAPRARGQVIAFPGERRGASARPLPIEPLDVEPLEPAEGEAPKPRPAVRLAASSPERPERAFPWLFVGLGLTTVAVGLVVWAVRNDGTYRTPGALVTAPPPIAVSANPAAPAVAAVDTHYREVLEDLKRRTVPELRELAGTDPDALEAALLVELSRLDVGIRRVRAPITAWETPDGGLPRAAEVEVWVSPGREEELERQILGIGLVAGRYLQLYDLTTPDIQVYLVGDDGGPMRRTIAAADARALYQNTLSPVDYLTR